MGSGLLKEKNKLYPIIMIGAFVANYIFNINVMIVIIVCIMIGLLCSMKGVQS